MKQNADLERLLTHYLLGKLSEDEMRSIEDAFFADDDLYEQLQESERELIDKYVRGELSASERESFEQHFISSPRRQERLRFARILNAHISTQKDLGKAEELKSKSWVSVWHKLTFKHALFKPALLTAVSVIIPLALTLGVWRTFFHESELSKGTSALKKAFQDQRPLQARVSEIDYAPFAKRGNEAKQIDDQQLALAERIFLNEVIDNPSSASHHALGRFYLTNRDFDKAIQHFQEALETDGENAALYSDLGAAYSERAVADYNNPNLNDLAKSLEHLNRAIEIDHSLLAAYFNKALCLQRMNASVSAREAWEDYLKRDGGSEWSREAERNLQSLQGQRINNRSPDEVFRDFLASYRQKNQAQGWRIQSQTKEMITGTMIPFQLARRFIAAILSDQVEEAEEALGAFRFAGELDKRQSGDPFFAELAEFYAAAGKKNPLKLKRAQDALEHGYQLCLRGRYSDALRRFEDAQNIFLQVANTWESKVVDYWLAYCFTQQGQLKKSNGLLTALAEYCQRRNYHWLEGQSYCWLANNSVLLGEYSQEVEQDKKALSIALAIGDLYNAQKTASQLAKGYKLLGRLEEALEYNRLSLPSADAYQVSPRQYWRSLNSLTDTLFAIRLYTAAEAYEREALELAVNQFNDPVLIHNTYLRLGQIYSGQQNYPAAEHSLELSLKSIKAIEDDLSTRKLFGQSALQMGNVKRLTGDYASSLNYYREALQMFDSTDVDLFNYVTHKGMLLCYLLNKDDSAVQQELPTVLSLFEKNRKRIKEEQNRNHFFDAEQDVYDMAIDYEYTREETEASFNYAEFSRARSLLGEMIEETTPGNDKASPDAVISAISQPMTVAELQKRLPTNLQLVEYAVLKNSLLIWVITGSEFRTVRRPLAASTLEATVNEYLRVLPRGDDDSIRQERLLAAQLYDQIFAPIEDYLNKGKEVVLVPDKFLFKIPFAALLSRQLDQRIVNNYTLFYSPSATILVLCSDLARTKAQSKEEEVVLSIGDPKFNRRRYPNLSDLPGAVTEARTISSLYLDFATFVTHEAVKKQIEIKLPWADVIHFATHYFVDDFSSARSRLVLTASLGASVTDGSDDLYLEEIQAKRLPKAKVVVLAACNSGIERYYAGEGVIGLSRAFIMARVPLVIASQWEVESLSTSKLMIDFHTLRKTEPLSTTEALRQAQINMLSLEDERYRRPYYWAGFFPIGGYASY